MHYIYVECNNMYGNWRDRQRGYLGASGNWDIVQEEY